MIQQAERGRVVLPMSVLARIVSFAARDELESLMDVCQAFEYIAMELHWEILHLYSEVRIRSTSRAAVEGARGGERIEVGTDTLCLLGTDTERLGGHQLRDRGRNASPGLDERTEDRGVSKGRGLA